MTTTLENPKRERGVEGMGAANGRHMPAPAEALHHPPATPVPTPSLPPAAPHVAGAAPAGAAARPVKLNKRRLVKRVVLGALLAMGLGVGATYGRHYWQYASTHESTDDAFIDGHITQISPQVAGYVVKVDVTDNQELHKGDVIFEMDPRDFQAALDEANGKLAAARADLLASRSAVQQTAAQIAAAQAAVAQAKSDLAARAAENEQARTNLAQYTTARQSGVVSSTEWTKIETNALTAKAMLDAADKAVTASEAQVTQAEATLKTQQSKVAVSEAQIKTAQAAVEAATVNLSYTKVVAEEDGRVTHKAVEPGMWVTPILPVMALVSPNVFVTANFKETQLAHMRAGDPVEILVDAYPGVKFAGHVDSIQQGSGAEFSLLPPENATGNYVKVVQRVPVKIDFDGGDQGKLLGPGMSVVPEVTVK